MFLEGELMKFLTPIKILLPIIIGLSSATAFARSGGGGGSHTLEFGAGISTASQDDLNSWIVANSGQQLGSAYEFSLTYLYRFSGTMFSLAFRPSYFTQSNTGSASASLTGTTFMPLFRLYPLENNFIKFFMQIGMGFGSLSGTISNAAGKTDFTGSAFGMQAGLGADFCFTDSQCLTIEGNYRYLPIVRSTTSNASGTLGNGMTSVGELRLNNLDVQNTLTGIQGVIAYTLNF